MATSLNTNIEFIMKSNKSITAKTNELKALGLRGNDITYIKTKYAEYCTPTVSRPRATPFAYTFGIEVECLCNRHEVTRRMDDMGVPYNWSGRYYHSNGNAYFDFKSDGSLRTDRATTAGNYPIEMVSPVLDGATGLNEMKKALGVLNATGAQVNRSCGLHIHIGCTSMTDAQYVNTFKNYQMLEGLIDTFMARSRRGSNASYAKSIMCYNYSRCATPEDVLNVMHCDRYHKVNPCSWAGHRTIEFRQMQGSTNYDKISHWLHFVAKLVGWSKSNVLDHEVDSIEAVPFLTAAEKRFFKARIEEFAANEAA